MYAKSYNNDKTINSLRYDRFCSTISVYILLLTDLLETFSDVEYLTKPHDDKKITQLNKQLEKFNFFYLLKV